MEETCIERLNIINTLSNNNWVSDKDNFLDTYRALMRSKLDYCSTVYKFVKNFTKAIIKSTFHSALRIATDCTCPIHSPLFDVKEMTLDCAIKVHSFEITHPTTITSSTVTKLYASINTKFSPIFISDLPRRSEFTAPSNVNHHKSLYGK